MKEYRTELDDDTYQTTYEQQVAWFYLRDPMHDLGVAKREAQQVMESSYVRRAARMQCESQKDYYEYEFEGDPFA